jgi:fatty acid synthase subunit alpha, fungi type
MGAFHFEYQRFENDSFAGSDLREIKGSITCSLCDQIFTSPIHWTLATKFPESATHAVDFGPGGTSGIGPLTAKNMDGRVSGL